MSDDQWPSRLFATWPRHCARLSTVDGQGMRIRQVSLFELSPYVLWKRVSVRFSWHADRTPICRLLSWETPLMETIYHIMSAFRNNFYSQCMAYRSQFVSRCFTPLQNICHLGWDTSYSVLHDLCSSQVFKLVSRSIWPNVTQPEYLKLLVIIKLYRFCFVRVLYQLAICCHFKQNILNMQRVPCGALNYIVVFMCWIHSQNIR